MRDRFDEVEAVDAQVLVVSFGEPERVAWLVEDLNLPFRVAADPSRGVYQAFGLAKASFFRVWHPRVIVKYMKLIRSGMKIPHRDVAADLWQLGGDFVIDADGVVRYTYYSEGPEDRPSVDELIAELSSSRSDAS
ncbi:MAG: AhpC/TSA family protein [Deltaproteobacteria bacterium]|nr:AhpC/TSA family protein [Deltaproteobacteria bacterium]